MLDKGGCGDPLWQPAVSLGRRLWCMSAGVGSAGSTINAAAGTGFVDEDFGEHGEARGKAAPNPAGQIFAGGVIQAGNFIEIMVVEFRQEWGKGNFEVAEILEPSGVWIDRTVDGYLNAKRMAMEAKTFMVGGRVRQPMGGFKAKLFGNVYEKRGIVGHR